MFPGVNALHLKKMRFQNCCPTLCTNSEKVQKQFQNHSKTQENLKKISHQNSFKTEGSARIIIKCTVKRSFKEKHWSFKKKVESNTPVLKYYANYFRNKILAGKVHYVTSFMVIF